MASMRRSAARAATRKRAAPRNGCSRCAPRVMCGIRGGNAPSCGGSTIPQLAPGETMRVFPLSNWTEFDVWEYILARGHSGRAALFRGRAAGGASATARSSWSTTSGCRSRPGETAAEPMMVRFRSLGCYPLSAALLSQARTLDGDRGGAAHQPAIRTCRPADRHRRNLVDGTQETRRLFLMRRPIRRPRTAVPARDLLRIVACGSVDDGKSTLIGRCWSRPARSLEDQLAALAQLSQPLRHGGR